MKSLQSVVFYSIIGSIVYAQILNAIGKENPLLFLEEKSSQYGGSIYGNFIFNIDIPFSTVLVSC